MRNERRKTRMRNNNKIHYPRALRVVLTLAAFAATAMLAMTVGRFALAQRPVTITVRVDQPGAKIDPIFYGLMTEEINFSYDGGLYAELIRNRTFRDDPQNPVHWSVVKYGGGEGSISLENSPVPNTALTTALKLDVGSIAANQRVGAANEGYWGIPLKPNTTYRASFYAKAGSNFRGPLTVAIESNDGKTVFAKAGVSPISSEWKKYTATLKTGNVTSSSTNRFVISTGASEIGRAHV